MRKIILGALLGLTLSAQKTATVYIFRPYVHRRSLGAMTLSLDGKPLVHLKNGRYVAVELTRGEHVISDKRPTEVSETHRV